MVRIATSVFALALVASSLAQYSEASLEQFERSVQDSDIYARVDAALDDYHFVRDHLEEQYGRELTDIEARELSEQLEAREPFFLFKAVGKLISKISDSIKARKAKKAAQKAAKAAASGQPSQQRRRELGDIHEDVFARSLFGDEDDFFTREFENDIEARDFLDEEDLLARAAPGQEQQERRSWSELFLRNFELNERDLYSSIDELD